MKVIRIFAVVILACASAFAWPSCSGIWQQVPTGTSNAGGAIYVTGDHITFQCQPKQKPTGDPTQNILTNTSSSNSSAGASSTSSATGGNANQKQNQSQSSENNNQSSANNSGNNSEYSNETNIAAPKIPVATAYAPSTYPTVTCFKSYGAGMQTMPVGVSLGGGKIDENCAILEAAAKAKNRLSYCKVYVSNKYVKKAGVTLEDCMQEPQALPVVATPVVAQPTAPIVVYVPQPEIVLHDEVTVQATKPQVVAATPKRVTKKRTAKNCVIPQSLTKPIEK